MEKECIIKRLKEIKCELESVVIQKESNKAVFNFILWYGDEYVGRMAYSLVAGSKDYLATTRRTPLTSIICNDAIWRKLAKNFEYRDENYEIDVHERFFKNICSSDINFLIKIIGRLDGVRTSIPLHPGKLTKERLKDIRINLFNLRLMLTEYLNYKLYEKKKRKKED